MSSKKKADEKIIKRMNNIHTFMATRDNETCLQGTDEYGKDFTIWFNTIDLLEWIDKDYMIKQSIEYVKNLKDN